MSIRKFLLMATVVAASAGLSVMVVPAAVADPGISGSYNSVPDARLVDTRTGLGAPKAVVPAGGTLTFTATAGMAGVVSAVVLNVTVVGPQGSGYLTVFPAGTTRPLASTLNFRTGQNVPNLAVVKVGAGGKVSIYNGSSRPVNLLADIHGYFAGGSAPTESDVLVSQSPVRVLDTRTGVGAAKHQAAPYSVTKVQIAGRNGVPADASAAVVNLTAAVPTGHGYLTIYPGDPIPLASTLNYESGKTRANLSLVALAGDGSVSVYNGSGSPVDIVADTSGYFLGGAPTVDGSFLSSTPFRVFDSRLVGGHPAGALTTSKIRIFPSDDPTYSFLSNVSVNVIAVSPRANGFLTTWNGLGAMPAVSSSNFQVGDNVAGSVVLPVNPDGTISIYNGSYGTVDLVVDVNGFFLTPPAPQDAADRRIAGTGVPTADHLTKAIDRLQRSATNASPVSVRTAH